MSAVIDRRYKLRRAERDGIGLSVKRLGFNFCGVMPPIRLGRFEHMRRQRSSRDLPLVKLAVGLVIAAAIIFVIFVLVGLATHQSAHPPFESVPSAD